MMQRHFMWQSYQLRKLKIGRSEEHTSELQSQSNLVCRLLLEKKKHSEYVMYIPHNLRWCPATLSPCTSYATQKSDLTRPERLRTLHTLSCFLQPPAPSRPASD